MSHCSICGCSLDPQDIRTAYDEVYCEDCFSENYNYCNRCDEIISRDHTLWDGDGNPYCNDCYEDEYDDDCPDNPEVYDSDRKHVLQLSRNWLSGKSTTKTLIKINQKDFLLQKLRDMIGLVDLSIYIYGLTDREEYQLCASPNLIERVKEYVLINGNNYIVVEDIGCNRLGVSYTLRKDNLQLICNLIKALTTKKEPITE
jgi:hypothetical protein